ncbi:MAG: DNA-directed RNA polymerase subunit P [Thermoproteota archaeon]
MSGFESEPVYQCMRCGSVLTPEALVTREIKCPYCGFRALRKVRPQIAKRVKAW